MRRRHLISKKTLYSLSATMDAPFSNLQPHGYSFGELANCSETYLAPAICFIATLVTFEVPRNIAICHHIQ